MAYASTGFYVNPASIIAIAVIFPVLGIIAVVSRFVVRKRYNLAVKADDWLCLPALICLIATGVLYIYSSKHFFLGYRLSPDASPADVKALVATPEATELRMVEYASNILMALGTGLIRLSFLFFYYRIFRGRPFFITHWIMVSITVAWTISMVVTYFTICPYYLNPHITDKLSCPPMQLFLGVYAITGFVLDLAILSLPFPWIWRLRLPISQKWAVTSVFFCGGFTVAASCVRMVSGIEVLLERPGEYGNLIGLKSYGDLLGGAGVWLFWSYVENGTGLVVCCLLSLAPLIRAHAPKVLVGSHGNANNMQSRTGAQSLSLSSAATESHVVREPKSQYSLSTEGGQSNGSIIGAHTVDQYKPSV